MKYITWIITLPLTALAVIFAAGNTQYVPLYLSPFDEPVQTRLYMIGLAMLGIGFLCGALFVWLNSLKLNVKYRSEQKRADRLDRELERQKKESAEKDRKLREAEHPTQGGEPPLRLISGNGGRD